MTTPAMNDVASSSRRVFAIATWVAAVFVFVQFFTSSEFVQADPPSEFWIDVHGVTAYGVLVPALVASVVAVLSLRKSYRLLTILTVVWFFAAVGQWGTGHLISTFEMDGWIPFHVFFSSVVLTLALAAALGALTVLRGTGFALPRRR